MNMQVSKIFSPVLWIAASFAAMVEPAMAGTFIIRSNGEFGRVDGVPTVDGDAYDLSFVLEFGDPTAAGIPWNITTLGFEIDGMPFRVSPQSESSHMGILSPGIYIAGTELFEPRVEIFSPEGASILGTADFDFYFREEAIPVELSTESTGEDVLQQGLIVDFQSTWTTQVLGYERATGVTDVVVVPEAGVGLFLMVALGFSLLRRWRSTSRAV
jgi:hypothetical protein